MSSAVAALMEGHTPAARHARRSAYRAMCACCVPESDAEEGRSQHPSRKRPVLAWRTRLAAQQALAGNSDESTI